MEYVAALQKLGIHMAEQLPAKVRLAAVTPLGTDPTSDLLVGDFNSQTKERTLKPSCNWFPLKGYNKIDFMFKYTYFDILYIFMLIISEIKQKNEHECASRVQRFISSLQHHWGKDQKLLVYPLTLGDVCILGPIPHQARGHDCIGIFQCTVPGLIRGFMLGHCWIGKQWKPSPKPCAGISLSCSGVGNQSHGGACALEPRVQQGNAQQSML